MDATPLFDLNQLLKVFPADAPADEGYGSSLQLVGEDEFFIAVPVRRTVPRMLREGDRVRVQLLSASGPVVFHARVLRWRNDAIPLIGLAFPSQFEKLERRIFMRVGVLMEVMAAEHPDEGKEPVFQRAQSIDLSAGGIRIVWRRNLPPGTRMLVRFSLAPGGQPEEYRFMAEVKRAIPTGHGGSFQLGLQFLDITPKQQDMLTRFIFQKLAGVHRGHPLDSLPKAPTP